MLSEKTALNLVLKSFETLGMIQSGYEARDFAMFLSDKKIHSILEIGTGSGGMMYLMNKVCKPDICITLDMPWDKRDPKLPDNWGDRFAEYLPNVIQIFGDIHSEETRLKVIDALTIKSEKRWGGDPLDGNLTVCQDHQREVGLLFIDADHSYSGTKKHWEMYFPLVKEGGYVAFHDVRNGWGCGELYDELCAHYPHWEFTEEKNLFGIGVLQV